MVCFCTNHINSRRNEKPKTREGNRTRLRVPPKQYNNKWKRWKGEKGKRKKDNHDKPVQFRESHEPSHPKKKVDIQNPKWKTTVPHEISYESTGFQPEGTFKIACVA